MLANEILKYFMLDGKPLSCERYGNGHINETYRVVCDGGREYILQKINRHVFKQPDKLMGNITAVCAHLATKTSNPRSVLTVVKTTSGNGFYADADGDFWRVYDFITGSVCLESATAADFYESAVGFGSFSRMLADFPAETLYETISRFHDTPDRYAKFERSVAENRSGRAEKVAKEIEFARERANDAKILMDMLAKKELPLRVTHNDTKLNNVLFDAETRKALCVIDLDTVMPGLTAFDFGDSIRFGASSASEDETDLGKVSFVPSLYEAYAAGYFHACGSALTEAEAETLPEGAKLMTLECGVRFLTDYIDGDIYFGIKRPDHNLDRCRTQFKLVSDMESKWSDMKKTVSSLYRK